MDRLIVQIYTYYVLEDALAIAEAGADHIGITVVGERFSGIPCTRDPRWREVFEKTTVDVVREIFRAVRGRVKRVFMPLSEDVDEIVEMTREVDADIVHLVTDRGEEWLREVKQRTGCELMLSVFLTPGGWDENRAEYERALARSSVADYILVDTRIGSWIGITGRTHNWDISRRIVEECPKPVILAGGLSPENVVAALEKVRPAGVDSCTQLDLYPGKKNIERVRQFIRVVREWERKHLT